MTATSLAWRTACLTTTLLAAATTTWAQAPAGSVGPRPNVGPADRPLVNPVAVDRGARVWSAECVTCHGASARGGDKVPSLVRSLLVLRDRGGNELGPFLKKGHPLQSGRQSTALSDADVADIMQFIRQRINDTLRGSPLFVPGNILTGNAEAGSAYFAGAGGCATCHSATGDLAGLARRYTDPVDIQQRMLFPLTRPARGGGPSRTTVTAIVTPPNGVPVSGALLEHDDFFISVRTVSGVIRTIRKTAGVKIAITNPLQAHHEWLDRVTDQDMHDLTAYLVILK